MPFSPSSLLDVIKHNTSKKTAVARVIESNPQALPVIPKLITDPKRAVRTPEINNLELNRGLLETIHRQVSSNRQNNRNIVKLFPDIEMSIQILVSTILSPKKMTDIELMYRFDKKMTIPSAVSTGLLSSIKEYISDTYELEDKLPDIIREALFTSGSYCMAVIPEASVDELINSDLVSSMSTESFKIKADGIVNHLTGGINMRSAVTPSVSISKTTSAEEFASYLASSDLLNITDNGGLLKYGEMKESISKQLTMKSYKNRSTIAAESVDKIEYLDIFRKRSGNLGTSNTKVVKNRDEAKRTSVGAPMVVRFPSQSTIPVSTPGNEKEHIGYIVLLDENGKPLDAELSFDEASNSQNSTNTTKAQTPVQVAYQNLVADTSAKLDVRELFDMYKNVLEAQLFRSIQSTIGGKSVKIGNKNDVYFLMFNRALAEQRTSVLFIPKELMTYFTFYYDEFGIGKSILDNLSILCSLRSILLFARVMAQAKNAIDVTKVNVSLSPEDVDPEKTIQTVQDSVLKMRENFFPLGINNPVDLVNWIQRAGLQFAYSNNPLIPDVNISFESANINHNVPTDELEESLRKQTFQALGLPPETVDNAFSPEFATNVVNNNVLLSKRVLVYQRGLCKDLRKLVGLFIYNDEDLRDIIRANLAKNSEALFAGLNDRQKQSFTSDKEAFLESYIDAISEGILVELPKPENTNMTNLGAEYDIYKTGLESVMDSMISVDIFSEDISGELSAHIDTIRNVFKHHLLRQWCTDNNYFTEAMAIANINKKDVDTLMAAITSHLTGTMSNSTALLTVMQKFKEAVASDLKTVEGEGGEETSGGSSEPSNDSGAEEGGGGDAEGEDDLSLDF